MTIFLKTKETEFRVEVHLFAVQDFQNDEN